MSIHVALNPVTHYRCDRPSNLGPQLVRLRPASHSRTRILSCSLNLVWGRGFGDVSPLRGVSVGGGVYQPAVRVTAEPLSSVS